MMKLMQDLPDNVVGVKVGGTVTGEDYEKVLIPAVEEALKTYDKIRLLYVTEKDFDSYKLKAMLDDSKVGLGHYFSWDRIAVVSGVNWIEEGVKVFGFMIPGKIRIYGDNELEEAKAWISEERETMHVTLEEKEGIVTFEPVETIDKHDFEKASKIIDPYIESHSELKGLIIKAKSFPGWDSTDALITHIHFVKSHYKHIRKLAFVTDSKIIHITKFIAEHIIDLDIKLFEFDELAEARKWVLS